MVQNCLPPKVFWSSGLVLVSQISALKRNATQRTASVPSSSSWRPRVVRRSSRKRLVVFPSPIYALRQSTGENRRTSMPCNSSMLSVPRMLFDPKSSIPSLRSQAFDPSSSVQSLQSEVFNSKSCFQCSGDDPSSPPNLRTRRRKLYLYSTGQSIFPVQDVAGMWLKYGTKA